MTSNQSKKHRLHPFALLFFLFRNIVDWLWFIVVSLIGLGSQIDKLTSIDGTLVMIILASSLAFLVVFFAILRYLFFTYEISPEMITINKGIFIKKHIHIPYGRIQTISQDQWFFLTPFHLEQVKIETAGHDDSKPEGILPVVPESVKEEIEKYRVQARHLNRMTNGSDDVQPEPEIQTEPKDVYTISNHDLNLFAATSLGILPIIAVVGAIYNRVYDTIPHKYIDSAFAELAHLSVLLIIGTVVFFLIICFLISYVGLILKYYKFTITENENQLHTEQGLLSRKTFTIKNNRVQSVQISQNILRQFFKLATLRVLTASKIGKEDNDATLTVLPVIASDQAAGMMHKFISWMPETLPTLTRLPTRSYWYLIRNSVLLMLIIIIPCIYFLKWWGTISLILLPIAFFLGLYSAKNSGFSTANGQLVVSDGHLFNRSIYITELKNIQSFELRQSIWMTKTQLAHFTVNVRSGNGNKEIELRYYPKTEADRLFSFLSTYKSSRIKS
ncbi:PH domain-containing protein [Lentilactobacillus sp. Marseille-Q4993]|uniref:PH domain-containing protein n=1 Tax=Lentilactobacillus sp. Marseille-Q4993 TaxID=3039492 RepID=UPI0024BD40B5|nr:PH domain-containing protein [Lentilactobacillus sp. Marseille-Q4993]